MTVYNAMQEKLLSFTPELSDVFPITTSMTIYCKSTTMAHQVSDSHRMDGEIWRADIGAGPSGNYDLGEQFKAIRMRLSLFSQVCLY